MSAPPEVKGGVKTLGFYLLLNCTLKTSPLSDIITLKGPLVDHKNDFSLVKKEIKIPDMAEKELWVSALTRAVVLEDTLADISQIPPKPDPNDRSTQKRLVRFCFSSLRCRGTILTWRKLARLLKLAMAFIAWYFFLVI
jgi:hypothetical protein